MKKLKKRDLFFGRWIYLYQKDLLVDTHKTSIFLALNRKLNIMAVLADWEVGVEPFLTTGKNMVVFHVYFCSLRSACVAMKIDIKIGGRERRAFRCPDEP